MSALKFNEPVDGALWALERGFKVFPCRAREKTPAVEGWQRWAEDADARTVLGYAASNPGANWGIHLGGSGHTVLDIDDGYKADGSLRSGRTHFKQWLADKGLELPPTLAVNTPAGGIHLYFTGKGRNTTGAVCKDVDTRGEGGYVLCPGSVGRCYSSPEDIDGKVAHYVVISSQPVHALPDWLEAAMGKKAPAPVIEKEVDPGSRNNTLASMAGTLRARGANYQTIYAALTALNKTQFSEPLDEEEVQRVAASVARYEPNVARVAADFEAPDESQFTIRKASSIVAAEIPKRDWVMERTYLGRFITVLVSPGGIGKSTITLLDSLSICTGKALSGFGVVKQGPCLIYNAEDPLDEIERRTAAMAKYHGVPLKSLDNLHLMSGRRNPLVFAAPGENRETVINQGAVDALIKFVLDRNVVFLAVDPFVRTHLVNENDNMAVDKVVQAFQQVAETTKCALCLVHHTSKAAYNAEDTANAGLARGASSLVSAARVAQILTPMRDEDEAAKAGVPADRYRWYFKRENAKANLHAPADRADWYERAEVEIANGETIGVCRVADQARAAIEARRFELDAAIRANAGNIRPGELVPYRMLHPHKPTVAVARSDIRRAIAFAPGFEGYRLTEGGVLRLENEIKNTPSDSDFWG